MKKKVCVHFLNEQDDMQNKQDRTNPARALWPHLLQTYGIASLSIFGCSNSSEFFDSYKKLANFNAFCKKRNNRFLFDKISVFYATRNINHSFSKSIYQVHMETKTISTGGELAEGRLRGSKILRNGVTSSRNESYNLSFII